MNWNTFNKFDKLIYLLGVLVFFTLLALIGNFLNHFINKVFNVLK